MNDLRITLIRSTSGFRWLIGTPGRSDVLISREYETLADLRQECYEIIGAIEHDNFEVVDATGQSEVEQSATIKSSIFSAGILPGNKVFQAVSRHGWVVQIPVAECGEELMQAAVGLPVAVDGSDSVRLGDLVFHVARKIASVVGFDIYVVDRKQNAVLR